MATEELSQPTLADGRSPSWPRACAARSRPGDAGYDEARAIWNGATTGARRSSSAAPAPPT